LKEGIDHFCLSIRCDDIVAPAAAIEERGARLDSDVPVPRTGAYGRSPSIYLVDPDGYRVELKPR